MATKRQSKIQWYGDTLGTDGKAQPPVIAPDVERHLEGLNRGEIYICDNEEDPVLFIRTNKDTVVGIRGSASMVELAKYFLRKDQPDATQYLLRLLDGAEFGVFTQGLLGTGGAVTIDEDGNSHAEFDYLTIRKIATFIELLIQEAKSVGGMIVVSPSNMKVSKVEETDSAYRCYFEKTDGERTVLNQFEEGDQARRQTFNLETGQAYYWRLVTSVGDDYVDLSKTDCDTGSTVPQAGDEIVGIGNRTNKSRQSAIIMSAYGDGSPSIRYYQGIDSYSLTGKAVREDYYDLSTGRFKTVTYGDSYVGDREGKTFMKYDQENGVEVKGKVSMSSGSTGWENLEGLSGVIKDVSDAASAAQNAADNAQDAADNAQADAESANNRLDQWAEDGVISPTEKLSLKQELENLQSEYDTNIQNAQKYGIDTSAYTSAWTAYRQELEYHSQDTPENITIKETFATSQSSFYKSREDLLVSIANAAKEYADKLVSSVSVGAENLLLNTGFTGNYDPKVLSASTPLNKRTYMYSNRLENWSGAGTVNEDESSESGYSCSIGSISQSVSLIEGERYVVSYKAKGSSVTVSIGSNTWTDSLSSSYSVYSHKFEYSSGSVFAMAGSADVCEIKLERGTIPTDWCPSRKDTNEVADMFKQYWYLKDAMNGSTDVIGGLVLTSMIQLGKWTDGILERVNAGVSGIYNDDLDVAFWAGGTYPQAIATVRKIMSGDNPTDEEWKFLAKFVATHGGDLFLRGYIYALGGVFRGTVYAKDGVFSGSIYSNNGNIGDWIIKNSLQSSDFKMPEFQSPDPENDIEGGVVSGGEGSKLSKSGIVIGCSGNTTGVLPSSSGAKLAGIINAEGKNAWVQALYISAKNTDTYGYLSDTIALELNASCTYENPMHKPKALKISSGFADIPGVILAGRISANGDIIYGYGKNNPAFTCSRNGDDNDYEYTITHYIGHNRYTVEATPYISTSTWRKVHAIITYMDRSIFRVRLVDSGTENDGEAYDFMFSVIGDNY